MALELAAILAFVTALSFGANALIVKVGMTEVREASGVSPSFTAAFVSILTSAVIFIAVTIGFGVPIEAVTPRAIAPFLVAGVLYPAMFRLFYFRGIDVVGASIAAALVAANPAVAALVAVPILGEEVTVLTAVGIAFIVGGGAVLQASQGAEGSAADRIVRELRQASPRELLFPVAAAVSVGVGYVMIKFGLNGFPHPPAATAITQLAGLVTFGALLGLSAERRSAFRTTLEHRRALGIFVLAGGIVATGWLAQFFALQLGTVVVVIPLVNTFPLVVVAGTYLKARELPRSRAVILGVVAIVVGATMIQAF